MRIISLECGFLEYTVTHPITACARQDDADESGRTGTHEHCLYLLVAVEPRDLVKVNRAYKAIRRLIGQSGAKTVVINGWVHFTESELADDSTSRLVLSRLAQRLAPELTVDLMPHGWSKTWHLNVLSQPFSQRYIHV